MVEQVEEFGPELNFGPVSPLRYPGVLHDGKVPAGKARSAQRVSTRVSESSQSLRRNRSRIEITAVGARRLVAVCATQHLVGALARYTGQSSISTGKKAERLSTRNAVNARQSPAGNHGTHDFALH